MIITNEHDISLLMGVWLLHDEYDYINDPNYISATTIMKPLKQIILSKRINYNEVSLDVSEKIASRLGSSIHDSVEKAWRDNPSKRLQQLGLPKEIADKIKVNPSDEELKQDPSIIPVWFEVRSFKKIGKYTIGGKFDAVLDNTVFDNKSTSVFSYLKNNKDEDYTKQGSIYKWLRPDLIKSNQIYINFIFTDWQKAMLKTIPDYPPLRVQEKAYPLWEPEETEQWITEKLNLIDKYMDAPESDMPDCTDKELWKSDPQFKYYSDPSKTDGRATKNFDSLIEATEYLNSKGKGIVKTIPGEVKACGYCPAKDICKQREPYV